MPIIYISDIGIYQNRSFSSLITNLNKT